MNAQLYDELKKAQLENMVELQKQFISHMNEVKKEIVSSLSLSKYYQPTIVLLFIALLMFSIFSHTQTVNKMEKNTNGLVEYVKLKSKRPIPPIQNDQSFTEEDDDGITVLKND